MTIGRTHQARRRRRDQRRKSADSGSIDRNHLIASVAGTLGILEVFGNSSGAMTLSAVAEAIGRPKGTVHRMLSTLVNTGFVTQDRESGRYLLTLKLWRLGTSAVRDLEIVKIAWPWLEKLVATIDETAHLAVLDVSGNVTYVSKIESPRSIRVQTQLGQLTPSWCTATGRCLLAFNPGVADRVLAGPLEMRTPHTITDPGRIRSVLDDVAARGVAVTKAENHPEMGGIAAPIRDHSGNVIASCGIGVPVFRMDRRLIDNAIPVVVRTADSISLALGHQRTVKKRFAHGA